MDLFTLDAFSVFLQVIFVDLILAADNAIIVAMVATQVPEHLRRNVILFGVGAAVVMRILFSLAAVQLMAIPGIKLIAGGLLLWVCYRLWKDIRDGALDGFSASGDNEYPPEHAPAAGKKPITGLGQAIFSIVMADLSMSIDNVVAIAGLSRDYPVILVFGLVLSVAFMIFAATIISKVLQRFAWINYAGLAIILLVALQMLYEGSHELTGLFQ